MRGGRHTGHCKRTLQTHCTPRRWRPSQWCSWAPGGAAAAAPRLSTACRAVKVVQGVWGWNAGGEGCTRPPGCTDISEASGGWPAAAAAAAAAGLQGKSTDVTCPPSPVALQASLLCQPPVLIATPACCRCCCCATTAAFTGRCGGTVCVGATLAAAVCPNGLHVHQHQLRADLPGFFHLRVGGRKGAVIGTAMKHCVGRAGRHL